MADALSSGTPQRLEGLFAKLREILSLHDIRTFAVFSLSGGDAQLAFSCGAVEPHDVLGQGRFAVSSLRSLLIPAPGITIAAMRPSTTTTTSNSRTEKPCMWRRAFTGRRGRRSPSR